MGYMTSRIALALLLLWENVISIEGFGSSNLRRQQQEERKLSWGYYDGVFYNMLLAADYTVVQGDVAVQEASSEGLPYVAYLDDGDVLTYRLTLQSTGSYQMQIRVASPLGDGKIELRNSQNVTQIYASIETIPASEDWNSWRTLETTLDLPETEIDLDLVVVEGGWNLLWLSLELLEINETSTTIPTTVASPVAAPTSEPPPVASPLHDDTCIVSLNAGDYTSKDEAAQLSSQDNSLGLETNSWVTYTANIPTDGTYLLQMKFTLSSATGAFDLTDAGNQKLYTSIKESTIDSWRSINTVLLLEAGAHIMKINIVDGSWQLSSLCLDRISFFNVDYIESSNTTTMSPTSPPFGNPTLTPTTAPTQATNSSQIMQTPTVSPAEMIESDSTTTTSPMSPSVSTPTLTPVALPAPAINASPIIQAPVALPTGVTESGNTTTVSPMNPSVSTPTLAPVASPTQTTNNSQIIPAPTASPTTQSDSGNSSTMSPTNPSVSTQALALSANETSSMYGVVLGTSNENLPSITQLDVYDWVRYPVTTVTGGIYTMEMRVSSSSGEGAFDLIDYGTGSNYSSFDSIPATGIDKWETIKNTITLPAGDVHFMIRVREGGWMYSWIRFTEI